MGLLYYREEFKRHPDARRSTCTREQAEAAVRSLCRAWKMPAINVVFHEKKGKRGTWSWYRMDALKPGRKAGEPKFIPEHIDFSLAMLNYLTVAHEFAHYVHHHEFEDRRKAAKAARQKYKRELWHGPEHLQLTDEIVRVLTDQGLVKPAEPIKVDRQLIKAACAEFAKGLPASAECPRCHGTFLQEVFGVRVMKKTPAGLPKYMARQSYCQPCRSKPKEKTNA